MTTDTILREPPQKTASSACVLAAIERALAGLEYGSLALTVHAGKVVQIDVTNRTRF
ncbi:YezD family protein [Parablastomonas sp. CN1-191]|uniref:YezD family protein n=1 Tax=Parablastomonas sp. CN1-191 TaxID=3400908 RepID=UPI003BF91055